MRELGESGNGTGLTSHGAVSGAAAGVAAVTGLSRGCALGQPVKEEHCRKYSMRLLPSTSAGYNIPGA